MKATFKTQRQFEDEGFVPDYPDFYKGNKKQPDAVVRRHYIDNLGGKEVTIVAVIDYNTGRLEVEYRGHLYEVFTWMLVETVIFDKIKRPTRFRMHGRDAKFYGMVFKFPCAFSELSTKDAVKLARWVLKAAGAK